MSSVDDRIVSMTFDNSKFEDRISETIASLDRLTKALDFSQMQKGFEGISAEAGKVDVSNIGKGVDTIAGKLGALGVIGITALSKITSGVLDFAKNTAGDILGPIITGGKQRALNIEQAKFLFRGLGIDVEAGMKSALDAVLGTAYGLDEAAKAAAQFGASGIKVGPQMTSALRGVAGTAALTGASFSEMANIFTGAAAMGKVSNQDFNSFAVRGLNAAAAYAKVIGKTEAQVREMATKGEISFEKFADAMDKSFGEHSTKANETYAGSLANIKAAMSRLGASFFGDRLTQQRDIFNALTPAIDKVTAALKPMITVFNAAGRVGTDKIVAFIKGLTFENFTKSMANFAVVMKNTFGALSQIMGSVQKAYRDLFPKQTTSFFLSISKAMLSLSEKFKMGGQTLEKLRSIFRGVFSVIAIGIEIVKSIGLELLGLFSTVSRALGFSGGGILKFFSNLGDSLFNLKKYLVDNHKIQIFFEGVNAAIVAAAHVIGLFVEKVKQFFNNLKGGVEASAAVEHVSSSLEHLGGVWERFSKLPPGLVRFFEGVKKVFDSVWEYIKGWFSSLGEKIAGAFKPGDFNGAIDLLNLGLLGGLAVMIKKFMNGGLLQFVSGGGVMDRVNGVLDSLTGRLEAMQTSLKADALLKIGIAIGILAASVLILSLIDSAALAKALTAMAVGFGQLVGTLAILDKIAAGPKGAAKLGILVGALIALSGAMVIMSIALKILSTIDPVAMATALVGIGSGLGIMIFAMTKLPPSPGMIASGIAMTFIAGALLLLSAAVRSFAKLSWGDLAKGLVGVGVGLALVGAAMWLMPPGMILVGIGLLAVATALNIMALAMKIFATMSVAEIGKGLLGIGGGLLVIAGAMWLMPPNMIMTSLALVQVALALGIMAKAIKTMGEMKLGDLVKGLGALAIMLGILAIAMIVMTGTLAGASAMIIAAGALLILAGVLKVLGGMSLAEIVKGLFSLAGVLIVLGAAAIILGPLIPTLFALGVALGVIGIAMALFGLGAFLVAKAFEAMAAAGKAGVGALIDVIEMFITALPRFVGAFIKALLDMAFELLNAAPLLLRLVTAILSQLLNTVIELMPKIGQAIAAIITTGLKLIRDLLPDILATGYLVLLTLLRGFRDNIEEIATLGIDIVVKLTNTLIQNAVKLAAAAIELLLKFLGAIAERTADIVATGLSILLGLIKGIVENVGQIITVATDIVEAFILGVSNNIDRLITAGTDAMIAFLDGLASDTLKVVTAAKDIVLALIKGITDNTVDFARKAADLLINFLNELAAVIREKTPELIKAGKNISGAIIDGMLLGLKETPVIGKAIEMAQGIVGAVKGVFDSKSPSKVFMRIGKDLINGLSIGIDNDGAKHSAIKQSRGVVKAFQGALTELNLADLGEFAPVITPVLDLTKVRLASRDLNGLLSMSPISPDVSYDRARTIATTADLEAEANAAPVYTGPAEVTFEQNIFAPSALSTNDIYRNTKGQIALAKEELSIP